MRHDLLELGSLNVELCFNVLKRVPKSPHARRVPREQGRLDVHEVIEKYRVAPAVRLTILAVAPAFLHAALEEVNCSFIAGEAVVADGIALTVLDADAVLIVGEIVGENDRFVAVSAPDAVPAAVEFVADNLIAAEGDFNTVRRGKRKVILVNQVVVGSARAGIHRRLAGPEEKAIAAVGGAVPGDDVVAGLLVHQNRRRVLAAVVDALAVAAHVEVQAVVHDAVAGAAVHADADGAVERDAAAVDHAVIAVGHHHPILPAGDFQTGDGEPIAVIEIDGRAEAEPLTVFVVVVAHPVAHILLPRRALEALAVVVGKVAILERQTSRAAGEQADLVAARGEIFDGDVVALDDDGHAGELVGSGRVISADQRRAGEVDNEVVAANDDGGRIEVGRVDPMLAGGDGAALGDYHSRRGRCLRRCMGNEGHDRKYKTKTSEHASHDARHEPKVIVASAVGRAAPTLQSQFKAGAEIQAVINLGQRVEVARVEAAAELLLERIADADDELHLVRVGVVADAKLDLAALEKHTIVTVLKLIPVGGQRRAVQAAKQSEIAKHFVVGASIEGVGDDVIDTQAESVVRLPHHAAEGKAEGERQLVADLAQVLRAWQRPVGEKCAVAVVIDDDAE